VIIRPQYALGNEEPLPGARELMLVVLGGFIGFLALERLIGGGRKRNPEDEARRCPLRTKMYGGLPGGGGYQAYTEYEIGAQRTAEAVHCLLGAVGNLLDPRSRVCPSWEYHLFYQGEHIHEEMGLIDDCIKEYSRPLYSERILPKNIFKQPWKKPVYAQDALVHAKKSVVSIMEASPRLIATAKKNLEALDPSSMPEPIWMVADRAYKLVIALAKAMEQSVRDYPVRVDNAFQNDRVQYRAFLLRAAVDRLLAMRPKERAC
jgi:hypothetical protein